MSISDLSHNDKLITDIKNDGLIIDVKNNLSKYINNDCITHKCKNAFILGITGSYAYGTNTDTSDIDLRGILPETPDELLGMYQSDTYTENKCTDITLHPFRKAVSLLMKGNPTMLELLALPTEYYIHISNEGRELIKHGPTLFLSQKIILPYKGCIYSHKKCANKYVNEHDMNKANKYRAHIIRMYITAITALNSGKFIVRLPEKELAVVQKIRFGKSNIEYDSIEEYYENLFNLACKKTHLPESVNFEAVNAFVKEINCKLLDDYYKT